MSEEVSITWHGHACFTLDMGKKIVVDPFINDNPAAKIKRDDIKADVVAVTHGHYDHVADAVYIAKKNNAPIVAIFELGNLLQEEDKDVQIIGMNMSGTTTVEGIQITAVPATHSSGYGEKYGGNPMGFIFGDGIKVYHAGDTGVFKDMELIQELYKPDISLLPIGGFFTMGPDEATYAAGILKSKVIIPMHYNTFDAIKQDAQEFKKKVEAAHKAKVFVPTVEEEIRFDRKTLQSL